MAMKQERQCTYEHNIEVHLHNHWWHGKAGGIAYSACVSVALLCSVQCAYVVLLSVASLALPYFPTLSHKWHDFQKKIIELEMCVLIFPTTFV